LLLFSKNPEASINKRNSNIKSDGIFHRFLYCTAYSSGIWVLYTFLLFLPIVNHKIPSA
jgi:hypothetical protein